MQPYYGDEPHIIQKRTKKSRDYGGRRGACRRRVLPVFLILLLCSVVPIAATYAFLSGTTEAAGRIYRVKAETRYFLVTGSYDVTGDARLAAAAVKEKGGAGYVINDGKFRVVAAVYRDKKTAEAVAAKQKNDNEIYPVTIKETSLGENAEIAKRLSAALDICDSVFTDVTSVTEEYERGNLTDGALTLAVKNAAERLTEAARKINDADETGLIVEYLTAMSGMLNDATTEDKYTLPVRVRYALCAIVYERYAMSLKLSPANS